MNKQETGKPQTVFLGALRIGHRALSPKDITSGAEQQGCTPYWVGSPPVRAPSPPLMFTILGMLDKLTDLFDLSEDEGDGPSDP